MTDYAEEFPSVVAVPEDDVEQQALPLPGLSETAADDEPDQFDPVTGYDESGSGEGLPVEEAQSRLRQTEAD